MDDSSLEGQNGVNDKLLPKDIELQNKNLEEIKNKLEKEHKEKMQKEINKHQEQQEQTLKETKVYNVSQAGLNPIKAMVILAGPGEDKSGLCDLFSGTENNFPANPEKTIGRLVKWRGDGNQFLLIDTPVFEPEEDMAKKTMMNELKQFTNMYVFVIVLNGTNPRIDKKRKEMIRELKKMFGDTFIDTNTVFAITNWHYDQGSIDKREKSKKKEVTWTENLQKELKLTNVKIAFLDAFYGEEKTEKDKIEEQLNKMKDWLFTTIPSYPCSHFK